VRESSAVIGNFFAHREKTFEKGGRKEGKERGKVEKRGDRCF
jgi:hypothetical protein